MYKRQLDGVSGTDHHAIAQINPGMAHAGGVVGSFEKDQISGIWFGFADVLALVPVSYTHLDVYKRQDKHQPGSGVVKHHLHEFLLVKVHGHPSLSGRPWDCTPWHRTFL